MNAKYKPSAILTAALLALGSAPALAQEDEPPTPLTDLLVGNVQAVEVYEGTETRVDITGDYVVSMHTRAGVLEPAPDSGPNDAHHWLTLEPEAMMVDVPRGAQPGDYLVGVGRGDTITPVLLRIPGLRDSQLVLTEAAVRTDGTTWWPMTSPTTTASMTITNDGNLLLAGTASALMQGDFSTELTSAELGEVLLMPGDSIQVELAASSLPHLEVDTFFLLETPFLNERQEEDTYVSAVAAPTVTAMPILALAVGGVVVLLLLVAACLIHLRQRSVRHVPVDTLS